MLLNPLFLLYLKDLGQLKKKKAEQKPKHVILEMFWLSVLTFVHNFWVFWVFLLTYCKDDWDFLFLSLHFLPVFLCVFMPYSFVFIQCYQEMEKRNVSVETKKGTGTGTKWE